MFGRLVTAHHPSFRITFFHVQRLGFSLKFPLVTVFSLFLQIKRFWVPCERYLKVDIFENFINFNNSQRFVKR